MKCVKLFALISLLFIGLGHAWGKNVTFTPGTDNTATAKSGVTISMSNTTGDNGYYQAYASSSMIVTSTAGNITAITFTCTASDYDVISKFLMQAKTIPCIKNISTDGITTDSDEGEKTSYSFTMNCQYADAAEVSAQ